MVKSLKKIFMVVLFANLIGFLVTGCFKSDKVIASVNKEQISNSLYYVFLWKAQQGLESLYPDIWKMNNVAGQSPEELAKGRALDSIAYYIAAKNKAEELGIALSKEEKTEIKENAKKAISDNSKVNELYGIKKKDYETFYTYVKYGEKVSQTLADSYEPNSQEIAKEIEVMKSQYTVPDEAKIIQILVNTKNELGEDLPEDKLQQAYEKAQDILNRACSGEDMHELAVTYSDDELAADNKGEYIFKRNELDPALEAVVFDKGKVGKVYPEIVETAIGYEIVKILEIHKATEEEIKEVAISRISKAYASNELMELGKLAHIEKKESYSDIHLMKIEE